MKGTFSLTRSNHYVLFSCHKSSMHEQVYIICAYIYLCIPPVYIRGRYRVTYSPFGTPIPDLLFVLYFAPKRWPLYTSLPSLPGQLVSNCVYPVRDNGRGLEGRREKSGYLFFLCFGPVSLVVVAPFHIIAPAYSPYSSPFSSRDIPQTRLPGNTLRWRDECRWLVEECSLDTHL